MYSWSDIARRTERVYDLITDSPSAHDNSEFYDSEWANYGAPSTMQSNALIDRLKRYFGCGIWAGKLFVLVVVVDYLIYCFLEIKYPRDKIDRCKAWPTAKVDDGFGVDGVVDGELERFGTVRQKDRYRRRDREAHEVVHGL